MGLSSRLDRIARHQAGESDREPPVRFVVNPGALPKGHRCGPDCGHFSFQMGEPPDQEPDDAAF